MKELVGLKETMRCSDAKAEEWHQVAVDCFEESLAIFNSEEYKLKKGWKKEQEDTKTGDVVYSQSTKDGKLFCLQTELAIDQELIFNDIIQNIDKEYQFNPSFETSQRVTWIGEQSDVIHVTMKDYLVVKGREMVTARVWRKVGDTLVIGGRSIDCHLIPPQKKIRAEVKFATARFSPSPNKANHCIMEYLTLGDLKGWIPKSVIDAVMSKFLLVDVVVQRKRVERILNGNSAASD